MPQGLGKFGQSGTRRPVDTGDDAAEVAVIEACEAGEAAAAESLATLFDGWTHVLGLWLCGREPIGDPGQPRRHRIGRHFPAGENVAQVPPQDPRLAGNRLHAMRRRRFQLADSAMG